MEIDPHYLIEVLLPYNQVTILSGASGSGKSTLACQWVDDWLRYGEVQHHPAASAKVAYIAMDRIGRDYAYKLSQLGIDSFAIHSMLDDPKYSPTILQDPRKRLELLRRLQDATAADCLILDPLSPFLPSKMNDYHEVAGAMVAMGRVCEECGLTVIGILHAAKHKTEGGYARSQDRTAGSMAIQAYCATKMFLTDCRESGEAYSLLDVIPVNAAIEQHRFTRDKEGRFIPYVIPGLVTPCDEILLLIPTAPHTITTANLQAKVMAELEMSEATFKRLIKKLLDSGAVGSPERGCYSKPKLPIQESE